MRRVRSKYGQFMIVEALLLAAITACVVPGMNFAARTHDLRTHSVPAAGAGLVIGTNHQNKTPYYVVFFHTQNGRQAEARIYDWPGASMPTRGDQVPIRYAPSDPTEATDARAFPGYMLPSVLLGLALVLVVGGGFGLWAMHREFEGKTVDRTAPHLPKDPYRPAGR